jgi:hypothetical protein
MIEDKQRINIKDIINLEQKSNGLVPFSPERDLTSSEWGTITEFVAYPGDLLEFDEYASHIFTHGSNLKIISPSRFKKIMSLETPWRDQKDELLENAAYNWFDRYVGRHPEGIGLFSHVYIHPTVTQWISKKAASYRSDPENFDHIKKVLHRFCGQGLLEERLDQLFFLKILYPNNFEDFDAERYFEDHIEKAKIPSQDVWNQERVQLVSKLRKVFPDRLEDLEINRKTWTELIGQMRDMDRNEHPEQFLQFVTDLSILAAKKIEVTSNGVIIDNNINDAILEKKDIPVRRRF